MSWSEDDGPKVYIGVTVDQKKELYKEVDTMREFICVDDRLSASGGCEAVVTARSIFCWIKF